MNSMRRFDDWCLKHPVTGVLAYVVLASIGMIVALRVTFPRFTFPNDFEFGTMLGVVIGVWAFLTILQRRRS